jgi:hypothetical protein
VKRPADCVQKNAVFTNMNIARSVQELAEGARKHVMNTTRKKHCIETGRERKRERERERVIPLSFSFCFIYRIFEVF